MNVKPHLLPSLICSHTPGTQNLAHPTPPFARFFLPGGATTPAPSAATGIGRWTCGGPSFRAEVTERETVSSCQGDCRADTEVHGQELGVGAFPSKGEQVLLKSHCCWPQRVPRGGAGDVPGAGRTPRKIVGVPKPTRLLPSPPTLGLARTLWGPNRCQVSCYSEHAKEDPGRVRRSCCLNEQRERQVSAGISRYLSSRLPDLFSGRRSWSRAGSQPCSAGPLQLLTLMESEPKATLSPQPAGLRTWGEET